MKSNGHKNSLLTWIRSDLTTDCTYIMWNKTCYQCSTVSREKAHWSQTCLTEVLSTEADIQRKCQLIPPQLKKTDESCWPSDAAERQIASSVSLSTCLSSTKSSLTHEYRKRGVEPVPNYTQSDQVCLTPFFLSASKLSYSIQMMMFMATTSFTSAQLLSNKNTPNKK